MGSDTVFAFDSAALSDKGCVRPHNEDSVGCFPELGLWVVADGMGGHAAGDVASGIVIEEMQTLGFAISMQDQRARALERVERAHQKILAHADLNSLRSVGTTLASLLVHGDALSCIWAGDSRVYLYRDHTLTAISRDHSEVAEMVAAGRMTALEARTAPRRNVITRAIGIGAQAQPEVVSGFVRHGDRFLICSDGVTEHLNDDEIGVLLGGQGAAHDIARTMIDEVISRGARDNVSAVVVLCRALPSQGDETEERDG